MSPFVISKTPNDASSCALAIRQWRFLFWGGGDGAELMRISKDYFAVPDILGEDGTITLQTIRSL